MPPAKKAKAKPVAKAKPKASAAKKAPARKPAAAAKRTTTSSARGRGDDYADYSGKFTVRLPRSLHQALVDRAEKEGVSLNLFVTNALSRTVASAGKKK